MMVVVVVMATRMMMNFDGDDTFYATGSFVLKNVLFPRLRIIARSDVLSIMHRISEDQ